MTLVGLAIELHDHLEGRMKHAFGGALSLAFVADPRGTVDIDLNIFMPTNRIDDIESTLVEIGLHPEVTDRGFLPAAGIRFRRSGTLSPVDVFLSIDDEVYAEIATRIVEHPFGPDRHPLPFLSAEDLVIFKLSFGRPKDWVDLAAIATARRDLDVAYIERQLVALRGPAMHPRLARLRRMVAEEPRPPRT